MSVSINTENSSCSESEGCKNLWHEISIFQKGEKCNDPNRVAQSGLKGSTYETTLF